MSNEQDIKFIYFDVGGVAVLDFSKTNKWEELLDDLGVKGSSRKAFSELFAKYELEVCTGLKLDAFIRVAKSQLNIEFPATYSMVSDFVSRFSANHQLVNIIKDLRGKYRLGLLTNMYPGMLAEINRQKLLPEINWDVVIDSSVIKIRKPQPEIFAVAEREAQTEPGNILFVENTHSHIDAAKARGWKTLLYDPANVVESNKLLLEFL